MNTEVLSELLGIPKLPAYLKQVEKILENILISDHSSLLEPSLRIVKNSGKRLRPFLVIAAVLVQDNDISEDTLQACAAIELVHIGTIVHDDIIDNADIRWGAPTINKKEGMNQALLVGDYLLALAAAQATTISKEIGYTIANTIAIMCDGQSQETVDEYNVNRSIASYNEVINKKTAALTAAACRIGAISANFSESQTAAVTIYGESFGMSFQLIDDLLDLLATSKAMGKPVGNDIKEGIYTFPILFALQSPEKDRARSWLGNHTSAKPDRSTIMETLKNAGAIDATLKEIRRHNEIASKTIEGLGANKVIKGMSKLPDIYLDWAIKKFPSRIR
ncbi:MAG TPA: polyprenyl synthetase family protein [Candidatus Saccharimonadales bacterium]|nr:polyprenyl synthetase family protein [Candidatus Saccharimonadales bacterium]